MAMKISVSFKEDEKYIFDFVNSQLSESIYIKQLILKDMGISQIETKKEVISKKNNILDF